jgi:hypothetical protein
MMMQVDAKVKEGPKLTVKVPLITMHEIHTRSTIKSVQICISYSQLLRFGFNFLTRRASVVF